MAANAKRVAAGALLIVLAAANAAAQRGQEAGLGGTITDATGAVLAGVQVTVSSPQLIGGPQIAATDDRGLYRFPALLPGVYDLSASHPGFERVQRSSIEIPVGFVLTVDLRLRITPVESRVDCRGDPAGDRRAELGVARQHLARAARESPRAPRAARLWTSPSWSLASRGAWRSAARHS